jgi:WD40 repeat protein
LAGEGCFLKVLEGATSKLICQIKVFGSQTIHGIVCRELARKENEQEVIIWGGFSLLVLRRRDFEKLLHQNVSSIEESATTVSDWILDVAISPSGDSCVLITAHNTVIQARLQENVQLLKFEILNSPSRSILYSAHLIWESESSVLVAAGTVFGEIIAWRCSVPSDKASPISRVLATFTGHEGSIFGVNISPPVLDQYGKSTRLLASCSDDRTIRVWDIYGAVSNSADYPDTPSEAGLRETGFGENQRQGAQSGTVDQCLAMVMGHASRIWHVKFEATSSQLSKTSPIGVFSFGEDSTAQKWSLKYASETQGIHDFDLKTDPDRHATLSHLKSFAFHSGKHIWSTATYLPKGTIEFLATGGADGKISLYKPLTKACDGFPLEIGVETVAPHSLACTFPVSHERSNGVFQSQEFDLEEILVSLRSKDGNPPLTEELSSRWEEDAVIQKSANRELTKRAKSKKAPKDVFNRYAFVTSNRILITTTFGRILLGTFGLSTFWEEVGLPASARQDLISYSVLSSDSEQSVVFLAGAKGAILMYHNGLILNVAQVDGKVADMFTLFERETKTLCLVATVLGRNQASVFSFEQHSLQGDDGWKLAKSEKYTLPDRFVVTSAGYKSGFLAFGARNGSFAIFKVGRFDGPTHTWNPNEAGDAITSIVTLLSEDDSSQNRFLITSRDGTYSILAAPVDCNTEVTSESSILAIHQGTPPFGPNIELAWFECHDLLLYGFKSKNFIVWNETQQYEIMNVECGGAHRSFAYSPFGYFVYTKASKLHIYSQPSASHQIIKRGGHGREIKSTAVSPYRNLIATGAEDTNIRIWRYEDTGSTLQNQFHCLAVVQKHTAGIQHLQWHGSKYLFSSGGNEEFFVWAVEQIPNFGIGIICEASCPDPSEYRDLRIMSFDVSELKSSAQVNGEPNLLISLAYSDSTLRSYAYSKSLGFKLIASGRYTSSCLTQMRHIRITSSKLYLLTAATDGNLTFWSSHKSSATIEGDYRPTPQLVKISTHKLHQNSIKCLDITVSTCRNKIYIATGGDDNALGFTIYNIDKIDANAKSIILRSAHTAAITGLSFVSKFGRADGEKRKQLRIVTSSNDQRVKEWSLSITDEEDPANGVELKEIGDTFTSVADVGDVALLRDGAEGAGTARKILVVGNGMEVFSVSSEI